jgi:HAD superfamily hydrolase (TIGR01549 family)
MPPLEAILFDAYGTLLRADARTLHRELPRLLGVDRRSWLEFVRNDLLVHPFADHAVFARHICDVMVPEHAEALEKACIELVERELGKVERNEGVLSLLSFLKRRGLKLGVVSNLSSTYKDPIDTLGLTEFFDVVMYSCDEGITKPDPEVYRRACRKLDVAPENVLFVGDSLLNDVVAPREFGMHVVHVGSNSEGFASIEQVSDLGWMALHVGDETTRLLSIGSRVRLGEHELRITKIEPVPDDQQGRYNLVYRTECVDDEGEKHVVFCKRFLLPESAHVEELAYHVHETIGLSSCRAQVVEGLEPFLVISCAPGTKFSGTLTPEIAYEIGRHHVFAYLFSNADMRPRNAFLDTAGGAAALTMVDLEHCFFNLALEASALEGADDPHTIDSLSAEELAVRGGKTVLSERAMRRARKTFIDTESAGPELVDAFRRGFTDLFREVQEKREELRSILMERVYRKPYLIIGTHAYRRAMAKIDVDDILSRLDKPAEEAYRMFA